MEKNTNEEEVITFRLNEVETKRAKTFCALHMMHVAHMPAGEAFCFKFIPTHIGIVAILQCMTCNEHIDLTDYENF